MKRQFLFLLIITNACVAQMKESEEARKKRQDSIIDEYLTKGAERYSYTTHMAEWQKCLDEGLAKDSTVARLWQEKAMPYFKARKYEVGMEYVNKSVFYDRREYLPYRAFIKCIFSKQYRLSIVDFEDAIHEFGNQYVMDHTYNFYIGLCYLQLNEYEKAEKLFKEYNDDILKNRQGLEHPTALFYYGISQYEQKKYDEAIITFDKTLKIYSNFSDVKYYKSICMAKLHRNREEISKIFKEAKEDGKKGYNTIGEYNTIYETYPYQKKWKD